MKIDLTLVHQVERPKSNLCATISIRTDRSLYLTIVSRGNSMYIDTPINDTIDFLESVLKETKRSVEVWDANKTKLEAVK